MKSSMRDLAQLHKDKLTTEDVRREGVADARPPEGRSAYIWSWC